MDGARPGHKVIFQGLRGAAHLNGVEGKLVRYNLESGVYRWSVRCSIPNTNGDINESIVNVKPENLLLKNPKVTEAKKEAKKEVKKEVKKEARWSVHGRCSNINGAQIEYLTRKEMKAKLGPMKEISDEDLFRKPPEEECPICFSPLGFDVNSKVYMSCCGKVVCVKCDYNMSKEDDGEDPCPFCRTTTFGKNAPRVTGIKGELIKLRKQVDKNEPVALLTMANIYRGGNLGVCQDKKKAFGYVLRSAQLGNADANYDLSCSYYTGTGVRKDIAKAVHYGSLAAMQGHAEARHNLGLHDLNNENHSRAVKHFRIAAEQGYANSRHRIEDIVSTGFISKQECDEILNTY